MSGKKPAPMWVNTLGAMAGGVVEACTLQPLDVLKTRMQMAPPGATLAGTASGMFKNEGTLAFYKGLSPFVAHLVLKYATRWHFNEFYRGCMAGKDGNVSRAATFIAGLGAGLTEAVLIVTPFEVTKTRLQTQTGTDKAALKYKNPIHCVQTIIAEEGPAALWKGNLPCMFRQGWNAFFLFGTYDSLKKLVLGKERDEKISGHQSLTLGIIAGALGPLTNNPFDVAKTRLMAQIEVGDARKYTGMVQCITTVAKEEGFKALMRGCSMRIARVAPGMGITFTIVESFKAWYSQQQD